MNYWPAIPLEFEGIPIRPCLVCGQLAPLSLELPPHVCGQCYRVSDWKSALAKLAEEHDVKLLQPDAA